MSGATAHRDGGAVAGPPAAGTASVRTAYERPFWQQPLRSLGDCPLCAAAVGVSSEKWLTQRCVCVSIGGGAQQSAAPESKPALDPTQLVGRRVKLKDGREGTIQVAGCAAYPTFCVSVTVHPQLWQLTDLPWCVRL